ncbi:MAG: neutral/alkaline non-lysosomal ceramidase N-terminal domain-containing protein [Polyangiaceae bacterium]
MKQFISLGVAIAALGCASPRMPAAHPVPEPTSADVSELEVGAARVDITPPPGASTFGHALESRIGVGVWTRLYCRAFYLQTRAQLGNGIAIVSCDLPQISTLLQREVAARVCPALPASRLMLTAIHTHAAPGHFFESKALGGLGSSHFPGFDPEMVHFLAGRIATAVTEARERAQRARMRWITDDLYGLTRNRSLASYRMNETLPARTSSQSSADLSPEQLAIDPKVRVLEFEAIDEKGEPLAPIGALAFFAMHPTVLGHRNRLFGADVFGVTDRIWDRQFRHDWVRVSPDIHECALQKYRDPACAAVARPDPVTAVLNTNEGDIVPVWSTGNVSEAKAVGEKLAQSLWDIHAKCTLKPAPGTSAHCGEWHDRVALDLRYIEGELPCAPLLPAVGTPPQRTLCRKGLLGLAAPRGGADHRTVFESLLSSSASGLDFETEDCQRPKVPFVGPLQKILAGTVTQVPFALVRVDNTWISFVPAELTVVSGARLNDAVQSIVDPDRKAGTDAVVAGLANGYIQYVATQEEYQQQAYEGASTLYGQYTAPYLAQVFEYLARAMRGQDVHTQLEFLTRNELGAAEPFEYQVADQNERLWRKEWDTPLAKLRAERKPLALCTLRNTEPPTLCFVWNDAGPARSGFSDAPWLSLAYPKSGETVTTCAAEELAGTQFSFNVCDPLSLVDDRGFSFTTRVHHQSGNAFTWSTLFQATQNDWAELRRFDRELQLRARGREGEPDVTSATFKASQLPRFCEAEQAAELCNHER